MTWTARNTGLTGSFLNVNFITFQPGTKHLPNENHELFIATDGGVLRTTNGGRNWAQLTLPDPSNAEFADDPAATVDELTFHWIALDFITASVLYVLAAKNSVERIWLYRSANTGETWISRGVTT